LGTLLRFGQRTPRGDAVSHGNGHNGDAHTNGHTNGDLKAFIRSAARDAVDRVEAQDPLSKENQGGETWLLIGPQRAYDPEVWRPDYSLLPKGDPERVAAEAGRPTPFSQSGRYQRAFDLLDALDKESGFDAADD
jgi:hypothetical protein